MHLFHTFIHACFMLECAGVTKNFTIFLNINGEHLVHNKYASLVRFCFFYRTVTEL